MSAAIDARGFKRTCLNCGARFYDMNKRPIVCPSCHTEFSGEVKIKTRKKADDDIEGKTAAEVAPETDDELDEHDPDATEVSLDEAQDMEAGDDDEEDVPAPDLDMDAGIGDLDEIDADDVDDFDDDLDDDIGLDDEDED